RGGPPRRVHGAGLPVRVPGAPVHGAARRAARRHRRPRDAVRRAVDDQSLQPDRHDSAHRARDQELDSARGVHQPTQGPGDGNARGRRRGRPHPAAADSHDVRGDDHGRLPRRDGPGGGLGLPPAAGLRDRGRHFLLDRADAVRRAGRVRTARPPHGGRSARRAGGPARGGGQKLAELSRSAAALEGAHAGELQARFASALLTEADYNAVLANRELARVARDRTRRAEEQLAVARARVATGAAVQTDSLQLRLELNRARVVLLQQESALRVSRLELGRRIGATGPVDAVAGDTLVLPELPLSLADAITDAAAQGPSYRQAAANERAAAAVFRAKL